MTAAKTPEEKYMAAALKLARRGLGWTSPNPMVGAVIVKGGRVIGQGYHKGYGGDHAEVDALNHATENVAGATMYVTLEPCNHYGKTPPCVDALAKSKIARVVVGMLDPDPRMKGKSIGILNSSGIATTVGVLEDDCRALNESYIKHRTTGLPFVTLKFAQTLDGRIATATGRSRWISSQASLKLAHKLRAQSDAILVGVGTVVKDNPELTTRLVKGRNPLRVVLDSSLRIPLDSKVLAGQDQAKTVVATVAWDEKDRLAALNQTGAEALVVPPAPGGKVDIKALLKILGERNVTSVLVEGGAETITSFLREGLWDKVVAIIAPRFMGSGTQTVGELNITDPALALKLKFTKVYRSGSDVVVEGERVKYLDNHS